MNFSYYKTVVLEKGLSFYKMMQPDDDDTGAFEFWTYGVLINFVGVFGILGNIVSMIVLSRPQMRSSMSCLLIGLAICDTVLILTSILMFGLPEIYFKTRVLRFYYVTLLPLIIKVAFVIAMAAQTSSVYLTLAVTLERYVAVCHPLRAKALCTHGRARNYVVVIIIASICYNIPRFFEVEIQEFPDEEFGSVYNINKSVYQENIFFFKIYLNWLYIIFIFCIPFTSISIFNLMIYKQVLNANRQRQNLSSTKKQEIALAKVLFCVVIVFLCCNVLAFLYRIIEVITDLRFLRVIVVSNLLVTTNSSVNFIIYVIFGDKFKRTFLKIFSKRRFG